MQILHAFYSGTKSEKKFNFGKPNNFPQKARIKVFGIFWNEPRIMNFPTRKQNTPIIKRNKLTQTQSMLARLCRENNDIFGEIELTI